MIENRPGGGGIPVAEAVSRAEPDGYTLMVSGVPIIVVGPAMNKNVGYDPMRDLTHIAYFGGTPNMLAVHRSLGTKTYAEFLAHARKQPTGTDYVSAGFGTMGNWAAEYLATLENIKLNHIAYKGGSQAIVDLIAGHVKASVLTWTAIDQHVRSGMLDALAVTSANRLAYLPDTPTFGELGHKNFVSLTWFSLSGPPKLPRDIVEKINAVVREGHEPAGNPQDDRARRDRDDAADAGRAQQVRAGRDRPLGAAGAPHHGRAAEVKEKAPGRVPGLAFNQFVRTGVTSRARPRRIAAGVPGSRAPSSSRPSPGIRTPCSPARRAAPASCRSCAARA